MLIRKYLVSENKFVYICFIESVTVQNYRHCSLCNELKIGYNLAIKNIKKMNIDKAKKEIASF